MVYYALDGFTRAYPLIIPFYSFLSGILNNNRKDLAFAIILIAADMLNHFIKNNIFRPIMKDKSFPILGFGVRPQNKNCGLFINNKISNSYGMPSGHSQIAWLFTTYSILNLQNHKYKSMKILLLIILASMTSYSRVYWSNCHTIQQVLVGGLIGIFFGYQAYNFLN